MRRELLISIGAIAAAALTPVLAAPQNDPVPDPSTRTAVRLRVDTLAMFMNNLAGLRVRVDGVVDKIASPRVFTMKHERRMMRSARVAIVLPEGEATIREGAPVRVTGIARTPLGAEVGPQQPSPSLTDKERDRIDALPIVMASAIDTPDGVHLVRPGPEKRSSLNDSVLLDSTLGTIANNARR
jgi:hypothetical protein